MRSFKINVYSCSGAECLEGSILLGSIPAPLPTFSVAVFSLALGYSQAKIITV